jgi:hypothetical protein
MARNTDNRNQRPGNGLTSASALRESAARGAEATRARSLEDDDGDEIGLLASMDPLETERYGHSVLGIVQGVFGKCPRSSDSDPILAKLNAACLLIALDDEAEEWARRMEGLKPKSSVVQMDLFATDAE